MLTLDHVQGQLNFSLCMQEVTGLSHHAYGCLAIVHVAYHSKITLWVALEVV